MASFIERRGKIMVMVRKGKYKHNPITRTFTKKTAAKTWAAKVEAQIEAGTYVDGRNARGVLVTELFDRYVEEVTKAKAPSTIKGETYRFGMLRQEFHNITLLQADTERVFGIFKGLLTRQNSRDEKKTLSKAYVRKLTQDVKNVFNMAQHVWNYTLPHGNVADAARAKLRYSNMLADYDQERDTRLQEGDYERIRRFQHKKAGTLFKFVVLFAIESGMRREEIRNMEWSRVYFDRRFYDLETQKSDHKRRRHRKGREVPLTRRAIAILRLVRMVRRNGKRAGYVWPWSQGDTMYRGAKRLYEALGIKETNFHDLRHEFGGFMIESGLHERVVGQALGHMDPKSTKRYTRAQANRLADLFDEKAVRK